MHITNKTSKKFHITFHQFDHTPYCLWPGPKANLQVNCPWAHLATFRSSLWLRLTRSRGTGTSSLSSSLGARPRACGPSCASAWMRGWGSTPGRWCTGRAKRRCGYAGVWSWRSSPVSAGGTACTQTASHLWRTSTERFKPPIMCKWQKQLCWLKSTWNGNHNAFYFHNVMDVWINECIPG